MTAADTLRHDVAMSTSESETTDNNSSSPAGASSSAAVASVAGFAVVIVAGLTAAMQGWPDNALVRLIFWLFMLVVLFFTGLLAAVTTGVTSRPHIDQSGIYPLFRGWFGQAAVDSQEQRKSAEKQVYFLGESRLSSMSRFIMLMSFSATIATGGILADSTAVVVGAMLIAPLITPLMGVALGLVDGRPDRLRQSAVMAGAGIAVSIFIGWFLPFMGDFGLSVETNSQITARVSPTLLDLIIALAAGAAGAYALSNAKAGASMSGVAIAIALVPPLCVVGACLHQGDWSGAFGSWIGFSTNLVGIIGAGGIVFLLSGISPLAGIEQRRHRVHTAAAGIGVLSLLVVLAIAANGASITRDANATGSARDVVEAWLGEDSEFAVVSVEVENDVIDVVLVGPGKPPQAKPLVSKLSSELDRDVKLDLQWVPRDRIRLDSE